MTAMTASSLLKQVRENYMEADLGQLEVWQGQLSIEFAWIAEQMGECKKNRALVELEIKKKMIQRGDKPTEDGIEREYYATEQGQFLAFNQEYIKAVGKMLTACRFKIEALRGRV